MVYSAAGAAGDSLSKLDQFGVTGPDFVQLILSDNLLIAFLRWLSFDNPGSSPIASKSYLDTSPSCGLGSLFQG